MTNSTGDHRRYNVSAITVLDQACKDQHKLDAPSTIVGQRYMDLANATRGVLGSVCDASFAGALSNIQSKIIELATQFPLSGNPVLGTIQVRVNGSLVAEDAVQNGRSDSASTNSISFHGSALPPSGSSINVTFDPKSRRFKLIHKDLIPNLSEVSRNESGLSPGRGE